MPVRNPSSLKTFRITVGAVLIALIGTFVLIIAALVQERENQIEAATAQAENTSQLVAAYMLQTLQKINMITLDVQEHVLPADMRAKRGQNPQRTEEIQRMLARKLSTIPEGSVLHLSNAHGDHIYSSLVEIPKINIADRYHFMRQREVANAGLVISPPLISRTTGKWAIVVTRRLNFEDGSFAGVINFIINLEDLDKIFTSLGVMHNGVVNMRDRQMRLMARSPAAKSGMGKPLANHPAAAYLRRGIDHAVYHAAGSDDGVMRLYSFREVGNFGLYVFAGIAEDDYLSEWKTHIKVYVLTSLMLTAVVLMMLQVIWRGLIERENTLVEMAREEDKFHTVADYTYDWEYWEGANHEMLFMSPSCERVTGYSPTEFQADPGLLYRIIYPDDQHLMTDHLHDAAYEDTNTLDFRIVRRDGDIRWIAHGCKAVLGHDGTFMGRRASNRDITERKLAEKALRHERDFADNLIGTAQAIILVLDLQGGIVRYNSYLENLSGYPLSEMKGRDWIENFLPEHERERIRTVFENASSGANTHGNINAIRTRTGEERLIEWFDKPLKDSEGNNIGLLAIGQDVTQRLEIENELKHYKDHLEEEVQQRTTELVLARNTAETANKELEGFSYSMSHDMYIPLRAIDGFSKILLDEYGGKLDDNGRRMLNVVRENVRRMGAQIDGILIFIRMSKLQIICEPIDIDSLARDSFAQLQAANPTRRMHLTIGKLPTAWGDREMLQQLLMNLLSNAVKFSPTDTEAAIELSGSSEEHENIYAVKDHGVGFDMQYANKLFRVFERVHPTGKYEGAAIGLALVKRIIDRHNGRVWAQSKIDEGATFYFALPRNGK